jgi:lysyl-tRNA synthetase class 2
MDLQMLQERAAIIRKVRFFFDNKKFLELDTPLLSPALIPESCLEVFQTKLVFPAGSVKKPQDLWLVPSPEVWMKKIIARHNVSVYQICKCFRNGESSGFLHNPEFTMLEYYTMEADYLDSLDLTEELLSFLDPVLFKTPFVRITVAEAFRRFAGVDLFDAAQKEGALEEAARGLGLEPPSGTDIQTLYDLIFIHAVEPRLKTENAVFLVDYPAFVPCLAKHSKDGRTVERWELYINGIELANCFSEETDAQKVRDFFANEAAAKEKYALVKHKNDYDFCSIFEPKNGAAFPRSSGVALGLDRLIMALTGRMNIDGVLPFSI